MSSIEKLGAAAAGVKNIALAGAVIVVLAGGAWLIWQVFGAVRKVVNPVPDLVKKFDENPALRDHLRDNMLLRQGDGFDEDGDFVPRGPLDL